MRQDPNEVFMAAFAKAIAEAGPDEIVNALMDRLMQKDGYGARDSTMLRVIMEAAVKNLAEEVLTKIVREHSEQLEVHLREQFSAARIEVQLGDVIHVVPTLKAESR